MGESCSTCQNKALALDEIGVEEDHKDEAKGEKVEGARRSLAPGSHPNPMASREVEEARQEERKKEVSVLTSKVNQTRSYQRFGISGVKLEKMPDYSNEVVKEKRKQFGAFVYDRDSLEVEGAESLGPVEF